jgi:fructokinase
MIIERIKCNCIFCDLNIRLDFHPDDVLKFALTKSNIVKMNDVEADIISRQLYGSYENDENISRRISHDYNIDVVCITKGSMGYSVYYQNEYKTCEAVKTQVRDTIGAGDAFSAAFLAHYCQTKDPLSSCLFGNYMGSYVASQSSAIPVYSEELKEIINEFLCK